MAFEDVKPILEKRDPALAKTLDPAVRRARPLLARHESGDGYVALHRAEQGRGQAARRRGQRPLGAAVPPDRGRAALTHPTRRSDPIPELNVSRRGLIGGTAGVAGVAAGFAGGAWYGDDRAETDGTPATGPPATYPFRGEHQAGIVTPGPGPPALRGVRRHDALARAAGVAAQGVDRPPPTG